MLATWAPEIQGYAWRSHGAPISPVRNQTVDL